MSQTAIQQTNEKSVLGPDTFPFFVTIPHSGEKIPDSCGWLKKLPEEILMCDIDRYVDVLYQDILQHLGIPYHKTEWHRYAVDLNRVPEDVDSTSLEGSLNPAGQHNRGYHWVVTTLNDQLLPQPLTMKHHQELTDLIYTPFHERVRHLFETFKKRHHRQVFHLDAHSMPSVGTKMHKDPGEHRADIVISDSLGKSCDPQYRDLVIAAYATAGFKVGYNWPYFGGRLTEQYGQPQAGQHTIQVELNRALYMDEKTKKINSNHPEISAKIAMALSYIKSELPKILIKE